MAATQFEQRQSIPLWVWGMGLVLLSSVVSLLLIASLRPESKTKMKQSAPSAMEENHLALAKQSLDGHRDLGSCRQALAHLNNYRMTKSNENPRNELPKIVTEEIMSKYKDYMQSITSPGMDAWYIEESLFFRDVIIAGEFSLKTKDAPTSIKAATDLWDWVMREVTLQDSPLESAMKAPLHWVLRRGTGTAEERSLIFLAMLRQVGIPGLSACLIRFSSKEYPFNIIVGVRTQDSKLYLFDPVLGLPLLDFHGLNLEKVIKGNWKIEEWTGKASSETETSRCWNHALFGISIPLPALAPRNHDLSFLFPEDPNAIPFSDINKEIDIWETTLKLAGITNPKVSLDIPSITRWPGFLPGTEGGDGNPNLAKLFSFSYVPWDLLPKEILEAHPLLSRVEVQNTLGMPVPQQVGEKLMFGVFAPIFKNWHETEGKGRDLLVRFQFSKLVPELKQEKEEIQGMVSKKFNDDERAYLRKWFSDSNTVYANLARKGSNATTDELVNDLWDRAGPVFMTVLIPAAFARTEEIQFALALAKHEQASQIDRKLAKKTPGFSLSDSANAWRSAAENWAQLSSDGKGHEDKVHLARFHGEALLKSGNPKRAKDVWIKNSGPKSPDARACAILAKTN